MVKIEANARISGLVLVHFKKKKSCLLALFINFIYLLKSYVCLYCFSFSS